MSYNWGYFLFIVLMILFVTSSWPLQFDDGILFIIFKVLTLVISGKIMLFFTGGINVVNNSIGLYLGGVKLFLIFCILSIKKLLAKLHIFIGLVMTLLLYVILLGGCCVFVLFMFLTVFHLLFVCFSLCIVCSFLACLMFLLVVFLLFLQDSQSSNS